MTSPYIQQAVARCKLPVSVWTTPKGNIIVDWPAGTIGGTPPQALAAYLSALQAYRAAEDDRGGLMDMEV